MTQYLVDHAISNVWCNPSQDNQLILEAKKITKPYGAINTFQLMNRKIALPTTGKRYHVLQVGQLHPSMLGLFETTPDWLTESWIKFSDAINNNKVYCNIYTASGMNLPRYKAWYMFSDDRTLVFAIELDENININYETDTIYVRLYSNAFFQSSRANQITDYLTCSGKDITSNDDILTLQAEFNDLATKPGKVSAYSNGYLINAVNLFTVKVGDTVEIVYDSSIKRVVTFTVSDLQTFDSVLDNKAKYILHYASGDNSTIDYQDDVDIYISNTNSFNESKGFYYHRNRTDSHRMITHRDYSIPVSYYMYIASALANSISVSPLDIHDFTISVYIRQSGYQRALVYDNSRLFELYKLTDDKVSQAFSGVNSTATIWNAGELENSAYTKIMRSRYEDITLDMVQKAYGYNAISKILGDTPVKTVISSSRKLAILPYELRTNSTMYEYDSEGKLITYGLHNLGNEYYCIDNDTALVEGICGTGTYRPDVTFGTNNILLPTLDNYRVYMCYIVDGLPNNSWIDITGGKEYTVSGNRLIWIGEVNNQYLMVRTDKLFLAYDLDIEPVNGNLFFTLSEEEDRGVGYVDYELPVPLGELDIFLNGKSLIRGLDYLVQFPQVYIINKEYLVQPVEESTQKVHIRFTGFCNSDLTMDAIEDIGFVEHGRLSNNNRFDIRDDKVLRIVVGGNLKHRSDLLFSESDDGVSVVNALNGQPYQVKDIVVPLKGLVSENTYSLRNKAMAIDTVISNYVTIKKPQTPTDAPSSINSLYPVVSPFINGVLYALTKGYIPENMITKQIGNQQVIELCQPYEYLLAFDPITEEYMPNSQYVAIHPHFSDSTVNLGLYQYRFLLRVVKLYASGLIELSPFLTFSA